MLESLHGADACAAWSLSKTELGQPCLDGPDAPFVSLAHSGEWLACAATPSGRVGVDIEALQPRDWPSLHDGFLHPSEAEWVMAVDGHARDVRAYSYWCLKEAGLKALGIGAVLPLDAIAFSPEGRLVVAPSTFGNREAWRTQVHVFDCAVLAVAWTPGHDRQPQNREAGMK
ncbi:MAG: 4'-phosphopantetheinyl transferase family protein [Ignavibacteria bacterium]